MKERKEFLKLVKAEAEFLLVNGDEIKEGDLFHFFGEIRKAEQLIAEPVGEKILACTKQLEGLPLLYLIQCNAVVRGIDLMNLGIDIFTRMSGIPKEENKDISNALRGQFGSGFANGYIQHEKDSADKKFTLDDVISAAKYGYEFRDTTSFPEHKFEDSCINNFKHKMQAETSEKTEWGVRVEMELASVVFGGGLIPKGQIGGKGNQAYETHKPKITNGYINIISIK